MDKEPITVEGLEKLKKELEDLKNNQRPKVVEEETKKLLKRSSIYINTM